MPNQAATVHNLFGQLVEIYNPRGQLATALRWRALAYQTIHEKSGHKSSVQGETRHQLLYGMRAIIEFAEADVVDNIPTEEHVRSLFEVAERLADMIHKDFMTAIFEVYTVKPGAVYDDTLMEAEDPATVRSGATAVCSTELGLRQIQKPSKDGEYPSESGMDERSEKVLVKAMVLL